MNPQTEQTQEEYDAKMRAAKTCEEVGKVMASRSVNQDCCSTQESARAKLERLIKLHHGIADESIGRTNRHRQKALQLTELLNALPSKLNPMADDGLRHLVTRSAP